MAPPRPCSPPSPSSSPTTTDACLRICNPSCTICKPELIDYSMTPSLFPPPTTTTPPPRRRRSVRIIHIKAPTVIKIDASHFRALVQQLTGNNNNSTAMSTKTAPLPSLPSTLHSGAATSQLQPFLLHLPSHSLTTPHSPIHTFPCFTDSHGSTSILSSNSVSRPLPCSFNAPPPSTPCSNHFHVAPLLPCSSHSPAPMTPIHAPGPMISCSNVDTRPPMMLCSDSQSLPLVSAMAQPPQNISPGTLPLLLTPHAFMAQQSLHPFIDDDVKSTCPPIVCSSPSFTSRENPMSKQTNSSASALTESYESFQSSSQPAHEEICPVSSTYSSTKQNEQSCSLSSGRFISRHLSRECATNTKGVVLSREGESHLDGETSNGSDVDMVESASNNGEDEEGMVLQTRSQKLEAGAIWRSEESSPPWIHGDNQSNISSLSTDSTSGGTCESSDDSTKWDIIWGLLSASLPAMDTSNALPPLQQHHINTSIPMSQPEDHIVSRSRHIPARFL